MSHTATAYEAPSISQAAAKYAKPAEQTLLERIFSRLGKFARNYGAGHSLARRPSSYIEENLTDPVLGPEIRRALR